ncbi:MAG: hypothetical protein IIB45_00150 [Candidatus Marinimicrobia bacterium]|nr:hypothetical protein [Candidatus Neomarinimicrobiota bacterium]
MTKETIQDDLAFIKKIVEESRKNVCASGIHLIVWGILVSIGLMVSWFLVTYYPIERGNEWFHWALVITGGWLFELIYGWKVDSKRPVRTYAEKADGMLWLSIGITMTILGFVGGVTGAINTHFLSPIFSTTLAIGYFTSGVLYDVKWVRNLAFGWWAGAIIMFIFPGLYHLLLMTGMMIVFQTIPGYIIYKNWG